MVELVEDATTVCVDAIVTGGKLAISIVGASDAVDFDNVIDEYTAGSVSDTEAGGADGAVTDIGRLLCTCVDSLSAIL